MLTAPYEAATPPTDPDAVGPAFVTDGNVTVVAFTSRDVTRARAHASECGTERTVRVVDARKRDSTADERPTWEADRVTRVDGPTDTTRVASVVGRWCRETDRSPVVWVPSVTGLLQYVSSGRAYRFANRLVDCVSAADGRVQLDVLRHAHDRATLETFRSLADAVIEPTSDGIECHRPRRDRRSSPAGTKFAVFVTLVASTGVGSTPVGRHRRGATNSTGWGGRSPSRSAI